MPQVYVSRSLGPVAAPIVSCVCFKALAACKLEPVFVLHARCLLSVVNECDEAADMLQRILLLLGQLACINQDLAVLRASLLSLQEVNSMATSAPWLSTSSDRQSRAPGESITVALTAQSTSSYQFRHQGRHVVAQQSWYMACCSQGESHGHEQLCSLDVGVPM